MVSESGDGGLVRQNTWCASATREHQPPRESYAEWMHARYPRASEARLPNRGDCFQKLGDLDATADEAQDLAAGALAWLVAEEIVSGELTDCALGGLASPPVVAASKHSAMPVTPTAGGRTRQRRRQRLTG